jgi:hypothetical protein
VLLIVLVLLVGMIIVGVCFSISSQVLVQFARIDARSSGLTDRYGLTIDCCGHLKTSKMKKGKQKTKKGKRTNNSYCLFPQNNY